MTHAALEPFAAATLPESPDPAAASAAAYATEVVELLSGLLLELVRERQPEIEPVLRGEREVTEVSPDAAGAHAAGPGHLVPAAQHRGTERGHAPAPADRGGAGTRAGARDLRPGVPRRRASPASRAADIQRMLEALRIRPVITAHPTEAKRVTVLEKHRRIYRRLVELESPRWTPRERQALVAGLRNDIELLWLTGELRLAKPTVPQEVYWGLHFFNETLFESVPDLMEKVERSLAQHYPGEVVHRPRLLPVRLLDRRRPGRQSVRHQRRHPQHAAGEPARGGAALPSPPGRAGACAQHHRARGAAQRPLSPGAGAGAGGHRRGGGDREPQSGRGLPAVPGDACSAGWRS